uniref:NADH-ubiquinone oxidoreductase chain 2 n=1 Tax=Ampithoe lacertosa TaxID=429030 RepID=A0A5P9W9G5_9CRUS|nr:NADH dehydrogenase subunit 2 [Ampithoe lacertosa]QFX74908.1 NADH dehydrogenase subunit 2 [Ampithoe lacertosa]
MFLHPVYISFFTIMLFSTLLMMSTNTWLITWLMIEINMLVFIPLMNLKKNKYQAESALKYFITQVTASIIMIVSIMSLTNSNQINTTMLMLALLLKMGVAPFHQWMPAIAEGLQWETMLILMIPQKIGPLILIHQVTLSNLMNTNMFLFITLTALIGSVGGLINFSLRKIMIYSSISHSGWMLMSILMSLKLWISYFSIYSVMLMAIITSFKNLKINNLKQMFFINNKLLKYLLMIMFLSLSGLPPFSGFLAKYLVILMAGMSGYKLIVIPLITATLISLFFYMRIILMNMFTVNSKIYKPMITKSSNKKLISINLLGLFSGWFFFLL